MVNNTEPKVGMLIDCLWCSQDEFEWFLAGTIIKVDIAWGRSSFTYRDQAGREHVGTAAEWAGRYRPARLCKWCGGSHPVTDYAYEHNPFCNACAAERAKLKITI